MKALHTLQTLLAALVAAASLAGPQTASSFSESPDPDSGSIRPTPAIANAPAQARRTKVAPALTEEQALQLLELELSRHVGKQIHEADFPTEARRWNWSGTTLVLVLMATDGSMKEVSVQRSSGFRLLDQQALRIVRRITAPPLPERLRGREVSVTVPIGFYIGER